MFLAILPSFTCLETPADFYLLAGRQLEIGQWGERPLPRAVSVCNRRVAAIEHGGHHLALPCAR